MTEITPAKASNIPYIIAVVVMSIVGVTGVFGVMWLRPEGDNGAAITAILASLAPTTLALLAFMKTQETHLAVNSRLESFLRTAEVNARAEGQQQGQKAAIDVITKLKE